MKTLGVLLKEGIDQNEIDQIFLQLDKELKYLHSKNYYVYIINYNTIVKNDEEVPTFLEIYKFNFSQNKQQIMDENIDDLNKTILGAYVYNISIQSGLSIPLDYVNYVEISKHSPDYISSNFERIKMSIPNYEEKELFYSNYIQGELSYYSDYISEKTSLNGNKKDSMTLVKATEVGKAISVNDDDKAAFINALAYPLLILSLLILVLSIIVFYIYIRG